jgi:hypothetical protein
VRVGTPWQGARAGDVEHVPAARESDGVAAVRVGASAARAGRVRLHARRALTKMSWRQAFCRNAQVGSAWRAAAIFPLVSRVLVLANVAVRP